MIKSLTSLRFFAAIAVIFHHLSYGHDIGAIAVTFFFVLSGFILSYNYHEEFRVLGKAKIAKYYLLRIARIYPVHLLTFLLSLPIVYYSNAKYNLIETLSNIFLMQSYYPCGNKVFSFNPVSWSISDEMVFYILLPFLLFLLAAIKAPDKRGMLAGIGIGIFAIAFVIAFPMRNTLFPFTFNWWFIYICPFFRLVDFSIGVILGMVFLTFNRETSRTVKSLVFFTIMEMLSIGSFIVSHYSTFHKYDAISYSLYYIPSICFIILAFAFQRGLLSSILSHKIFVHLGEISYSIYMIHYLVLTYICFFFLPTIMVKSEDPKHIIAQAIAFIISICLADIIYRYYEIQLRDIARDAIKKGALSKLFGRKASLSNPGVVVAANAAD